MAISNRPRYQYLIALAILVLVSGECQSITCNVSNCKTCSTSTKCSTCLSGYYLLSVTSCRSCMSYCDKCSSSSTCTTCSDGYSIDYTGSCLACPTGCKTCATSVYTSTSTCTSCMTGYTYKSNNSSCSPTSLSIGGVIGIVIGVVVGLIVLAIIISCCCKKRQLVSSNSTSVVMGGNGTYPQKMEQYNNQSQFMGQSPSHPAYVHPSYPPVYGGNAPTQMPYGAVPVQPPMSGAQPPMFGTQPQNDALPPGFI